ncbi:MAG: 16S rRNA processing protein RimM [Oscillospiraceae bacterium]|nr:16S rRNA processing protein RimM [Oscillospiraceae bacterium]
MTKRYLESGRILNTHGLRGEVKIDPWCDEPEFLLDFDRLYIDNVCYRVLSSRVQKNFVYIKFDGVDDLDKAIALKNKIVSINRNDNPLPEGEYYLQDLIGLKALGDADEELGTVSDILTLPSGKVYVIKGAREILVPGVDEFVREINMDEGFMRFHLIEGM